MTKTQYIIIKWTKPIVPIFSAIVVGLFSVACSLDESPKDQVEEDEAYTSSSDIYLNAVSSLYNNVGGNKDGQGLQGTCRGVYDLQTFGSDEALLPTRGVDWYDGGIWQALYKHSWTSSHDVVKNSWLYLYKVIAQCNHSLEILASYKDKLTHLEYERFTMEVRALRAIYYWYLLDLYGSVPIVTSSSVSINDVSQSLRSEVFEFVRTELEYVVPRLPAVRSVEKNSYYGHVTAPVVFFVLAKLYLNAEIYTDDNWTDSMHYNGSDMKFKINDTEKNAWEACIYYCDLIGQLGYRLELAYSSNFAIDNESSMENIWTIPMDKILYTNQQQNLFRSYHARHAASFGFTGENGSSASIAALEVYQYDTSEEDIRFLYNYWAAFVTGKNGLQVTDRLGDPLCYFPWQVDIDVSGTPFVEVAGARMKKYENDPNVRNDGKLMDNDIVLFRYADVLLMQAEAKVRNGGSGQAELDMVRNRVHEDLRPATLDNIYDERLLELAWEGWRRNDMIRFDRYKSTYNGSDAVDESDHHTIVFPIPSVVTTLNHYLRQNPGY